MQCVLWRFTTIYSYGNVRRSPTFDRSPGLVFGVVTTLLVGRQGKRGPVLTGTRGLSLLQNPLIDFGFHQAFY